MTPAASCPPAAKPLPPHGTPARAKGRPYSGIEGCRCADCRAACNRYNKRRRYLRETGQSLQIPAAPVTDHVRTLLDAGTPWLHILDTARVSAWTIHSLLRGQQIVHRSVADRILAVAPAPGPRTMVDATGSIRRIRALVALGHLSKHIGAEASLEHATISDLINGYLTEVRLDTARRIRVAYDALSMTVPPASPGKSRAVNRARREGWAPPLAWGEDLDSPEAQPAEGWHRQRLSSFDHVEEAEELRRIAGLNRAQAAERLGIRRDTLDVAYARTARRLVAR